ncbi:MAG: anti sigma factor C-terminal domain-containing protein [Bacillales bacterium]|mgnify:CR=1 FL=1|nr:anti sigma factor C-terminal domain-containing protein [Bacillales bacterium]
MEKEHEIDRFFDSKINETDLIKSARRKSYLRIAGISFLISILVFILLILLKIQLTPYLIHNKIVAKELYYEIYGANSYVGVWAEDYRLIGSSATAPKYKLLNGRPVQIGEISLNNSDNIIDKVSLGNSEFEQFSYMGNRIMNFFHPLLQYKKYAHDLYELDQLSDGKWIEMALSFDQAYTYDEVLAMLPKEVTLQWNWIDIYSPEELAGWKMSDEMSEEYFKEQEVVGFPSISEDGKEIENPMESFIETLELSLNKGGAYKKEFEQIYHTLKGNQSSLTNENIKIIGVVVVGDKQQLQSLLDKNYIQASSFGAIVDQY